MSHNASTLDTVQQPPTRMDTQSVHDIEVPSVHMQEPALEPDAWMDERDGNTASMGCSASPPSPPPPSIQRRRMRWWHRGRPVAADSPRDAALDTSEPGQAQASLPLKPIFYACLIGLATLVYLQYGARFDKVQDLLGTTLPVVESTGPTDPDLITPAIDPRMGGSEAQVADSAQEQADADPQRHELAQSPAVGVQAGMPHTTVLTGVQAAVPAELVEPMAMPMTDPSGTALREAVAAEIGGLEARMQRTEQLVRQLSQQLEQVKSLQGATVASVATHRPAQVRRATNAQPAAKSPAVAKADAPQAAEVLGPQLISVDMWNGEPSVVVTSGQPGDKRMRVLRPGDVVNGMALRSADPVSRTATFVAPGSQGLTLSVNQGG